MIDTIYLDMDGVLTNFENSAIKLGCYLGNYEVDWEPIWAAGDSFWSEMEWWKDGKEFYEWVFAFCKERNIKLEILSSVNIKGKHGKELWLAKNTEIPPEHWNIVGAGKEKARFAKENTLLVDDYSVNIEAFKAAGGNVLLYTTAKEAKEKLLAMF